MKKYGTHPNPYTSFVCILTHLPISLFIFTEQLKQFGKRMATDSFIQCFAMVNCLLLLGVVLYAILKGGGLSTGNEGTPKSPALRG